MIKPMAPGIPAIHSTHGYGHIITAHHFHTPDGEMHDIWVNDCYWQFNAVEGVVYSRATRAWLRETFGGVGHSYLSRFKFPHGRPREISATSDALCVRLSGNDKSDLSGRRTIRISQDDWDWCKRQGDASKYLRSLITKDRGDPIDQPRPSNRAVQGRWTYVCFGRILPISVRVEYGATTVDKENSEVLAELPSMVEEIDDSVVELMRTNGFLPLGRGWDVWYMKSREEKAIMNQDREVLVDSKLLRKLRVVLSYIRGILKAKSLDDIA